jgi:hypothetical protein
MWGIAFMDPYVIIDLGMLCVLARQNSSLAVY